MDDEFRREMRCWASSLGLRIHVTGGTEIVPAASRAWILVAFRRAAKVTSPLSSRVPRVRRNFENACRVLSLNHRESLFLLQVLQWLGRCWDVSGTADEFWQKRLPLGLYWRVLWVTLKRSGGFCLRSVVPPFRASIARCVSGFHT